MSPPSAGRTGESSASRAPVKAKRKAISQKTTSQKAAVAALAAADPVMAGLIEQCGTISGPPRKRADPEEHYGALLHAVVNQQLSVKAGAAIYGRLQERFGGRPPRPSSIFA